MVLECLNAIPASVDQIQSLFAIRDITVTAIGDNSARLILYSIIGLEYDLIEQDILSAHDSSSVDNSGSRVQPICDEPIDQLPAQCYL